MRQNNFCRRGFSLLEILLVVLLLSIVSAIVVPNFSPTYHTFLLSKTTESLADIMRYAQSRAVMNSHQVKLQFDADFLSYKLLQFDEEQGTFVDIHNRFGHAVVVPESLKVKSEASEVTFSQDGTMDPCEIEVCLEEQCYIISTKAQRGFIKVFQKEERG